LGLGFACDTRKIEEDPMALDSWESVPEGHFESAEVFAKTPFRSRQFLAVTSLVTLLGIMDFIALVRLSERLPGLPLSAYVCVFLIFGLTSASWLRMTLIHRRLHSLYVNSTVESSSPGSTVNIALRAASSLSYWGTISAAAVGGVGLGALVQVFSFMRGR
jgi:hypothetical protein